MATASFFLVDGVDEKRKRTPAVQACLFCDVVSHPVVDEELVAPGLAESQDAALTSVPFSDREPLFELGERLQKGQVGAVVDRDPVGIEHQR